MSPKNINKLSSVVIENGGSVAKSVFRRSLMSFYTGKDFSIPLTAAMM